jgi:hypothetical protein
MAFIMAAFMCALGVPIDIGPVSLPDVSFSSAERHKPFELLVDMGDPDAAFIGRSRARNYYNFIEIGHPRNQELHPIFRSFLGAPCALDDPGSRPHAFGTDNRLTN